MRPLLADPARCRHPPASGDLRPLRRRPRRGRRLTPEAIRAALAALAAERPGRTFCPSEAARRLAPEGWRGLMDAVRAEAGAMQYKGLLLATQGGRPVDPRTARGPIRLQLPGT